MTPVFLYGPLCDAELRRGLLGGGTAVPAVLPGYALRDGADGGWPVMAAAPGSSVEGLEMVLDPAPAARLAAYLGAMGADRSIVVETDGGGTACLRLREGRGAADFSLARWQGAHGAIERRVAAELALAPAGIAAAEVAFRLPTMRQRAASAVRAAACPAPRSLRADIHRDAVEVIERRQPYAHFFAVDETDLRHPHFDSGQSAEVNRAALVGCDTVAVLPFDPARDRVLLVEQFRFGPFARGDLYPWVLEPVAGRIDPGETPEAAARRETAEEAGIELGALHPVAAAYPSSGQITEFLHLYVGIAELPDAAGGLGGLDAEHEDIRAHVLSFDGMMSLAETGEIGSMPLLAAAWWLDRARRDGGVA